MSQPESDTKRFFQLISTFKQAGHCLLGMGLNELSYRPCWHGTARDSEASQAINTTRFAVGVLPDFPEFPSIRTLRQPWGVI